MILSIDKEHFKNLDTKFSRMGPLKGRVHVYLVILDSIRAVDNWPGSKNEVVTPIDWRPKEAGSRREATRPRRRQETVPSADKLNSRMTLIDKQRERAESFYSMRPFRSTREDVEVNLNGREAATRQ